jgi:hypothetical protein
MKRYLFAALVIALLALASGAQAAVVFTENFEYDPGNLTDSTAGNVSGGRWHHNTGTGYLIQCVSGSLSYTNYQASGIGNMMTLTHCTGSAEDTYANFDSPVTLGQQAYIAFLLNVVDTNGLAADTSTNGNYFFAVLPSSNTGTLYSSRLFIKKGTLGTSTYRLGILVGPISGTPVWRNVDISTGAAELIMIRHSLVAGAGNDTSGLWVNPNLPGGETASDVMMQAASGDTLSNIGRVAFRQAYVSNPRSSNPDAQIDGIVVGTSWLDIQGVMGSPAPAPAPAFRLQAARPNPVKSVTTLQYSLPVSGNASLVVFNVVGQKVATLASGSQAAGTHQVRWTSRDDQGNLVPNGIYFFQLTTGSSKETRKLTVVR